MRTWSDMTAGVWNGLNTLVGGGTAPAPAVIHCPTHSGALVCQNDLDALLMAPGGFAAGFEDPAVAFTAPASGAYTIKGDFRPTGAGADHAFLIYRNTREDVLYEQVFSTSAQLAQPYSIELEALAGDRLFTAVVMKTAGTPVPVAVHQYISRDVPAFPAKCGLAMRFENWSGAVPTQECGALAYTARRDTGGATYVDLTAPDMVTSVIPEHGMALSLREGDYLRPDNTIVMDYSGSFTVQMWMSFPIGFPSFTRGFAFADPNGDVSRGSGISINSSGRVWGELFWGLDVEDAALVTYDFPNDGQWRFVRLVRDRTAATLSLCIDGTLRSQDAVPAPADSQTVKAPEIGGWPNQSFAYWQGAVDDVRFISRALPCK